MGDAPYSEGQAHALDALIDDLNAQPLAFVAHVGDITSGRGPCTDSWLEARQRQFARIRHPFVLLVESYLRYSSNQAATRSILSRR